MTKITIASDSPCTLRVASSLPPSSVRYYCFSPRPLSEPCSRQMDKRLGSRPRPQFEILLNELFAGVLRFLRLGTGKRDSSEPILGVISTTTEIKLYLSRGSQVTTKGELGEKQRSTVAYRWRMLLRVRRVSEASKELDQRQLWAWPRTLVVCLEQGCLGEKQ